MRISNGFLYDRFLRSLELAREQSAESLRQLADGKRVRYASDDPTAAGRALQLRGELVRSEGYRRAAEGARFDLQAIEGALGEAFNRLAEARTLALASGSALGGDEAQAQEVEAIRDSLLALSNLRQNGRYLFAGTNTLTPAFDPATATYQGNASETQVAIGPQTTVASTVDGGDAFTGAGNAFDTLQNLADAIRARDLTGIETAIAELNGQLDRVSAARGQVGNRLETIERRLDGLVDEQQRLQEGIVGLENVSLEQVAVELAASETSANALTAAAARVLGRSLFDFFG